MIDVLFKESAAEGLNKSSMDVPEFAKENIEGKFNSFENADRPLYEQINEANSETQDVPEKSQIEINREEGDLREARVSSELKQMYPADDGYHIIPEQYLRNNEGQIVKDLNTGEARRVDFVVVKDGSVVHSIEVTSETASKEAQLAKEDRIRDQGGSWIRNPETGELSSYDDTKKTEVWRRA